MKTLRFVLPVVFCLGVGYFSGTVTRSSITTWYPTLVKPSFNPPNWIFAPVWTLLYAMMGIAAGLVWNKIHAQNEVVKKALSFFMLQLALNAIWSFLFFGINNILLALIEIVLLWLIIYETYLQFKKIDKIAGYLFIPYLSWVAFAAILNASIWWLNS
jgi:translocator protein